MDEDVVRLGRDENRARVKELRRDCCVVPRRRSGEDGNSSYVEILVSGDSGGVIELLVALKGMVLGWIGMRLSQRGGPVLLCFSFNFLLFPAAVAEINHKMAWARI